MQASVRGTHVLALVPPSVTDAPLSACSLFKQLWLLTIPSAALKPLYQAAVTISDTEFPPTRGFPRKSVPQFAVEDCDLRTSIGISTHLKKHMRYVCCGSPGNSGSHFVPFCVLQFLATDSYLNFMKRRLRGDSWSQLQFGTRTRALREQPMSAVPRRPPAGRPPSAGHVL